MSARTIGRLIAPSITREKRNDWFCNVIESMTIEMMVPRMKPSADKTATTRYGDRRMYFGIRNLAMKMRPTAVTTDMPPISMATRSDGLSSRPSSDAVTGIKVVSA